MAFGSDLAYVVKRASPGHAVDVLLSRFILYTGLNGQLELFAEVKFHNFLPGLKLFEHVVMRGVMLVRSAQSVGFLF